MKVKEVLRLLERRWVKEVLRLLERRWLVSGENKREPPTAQTSKQIRHGHRRGKTEH